MSRAERSLIEGSADGSTLRLDRHTWEHQGIERLESHQMYARDVWRCSRCGEVSMVFGHPPKVWVLRKGRHMAGKCPRWWSS